MQRIKITQAGWAGFTGNFGMIEFKDGVSVDPVPAHMLDRIAAQLTVVGVDDSGAEGGQVGIQQRMIASKCITAEVEQARAKQSEGEKIAETELDKLKDKAPAKFYTQAELEFVAGSDGIEGLREIAHKLGPDVKSRSIHGLIKAILKAQADLQAQIDAATAEAQNSKA